MYPPCPQLLLYCVQRDQGSGRWGVYSDPMPSHLLTSAGPQMNQFPSPPRPAPSFYFLYTQGLFMRYHFNNILIYILSPESGWESDLPTVVVELLIVIIIRHEKLTFIECLLYIGHHWKCLKRVRGTDYSLLHLFPCQGTFTRLTPPASLRPLLHFPSGPQQWLT